MRFRPSRFVPAGTAAFTVAALLLAGCSGAEPDEESAQPARAPSEPCYELGWKECPDEPYPFSTPVPPAEQTAIDGTYTRRVTEDITGAPGKCTRCPPYRLEPGPERLTFDRGRFFVSDDPPGYSSSGHFWVEGDRLRLFNDANCVTFEGIYEWSVSDGALRLEVVEDECPFTKLRQRYLMALDWNVAGSGVAGVPADCYPPGEEAAVTGHWPIPAQCAGGN